MLTDKVLGTVNKFNLLSLGDRVLAGVSGGPDSLALLHIFNELKLKLGIKLVVAHLNHGLRGNDSDLDEKFVKNICEKMSLDFYSKKISWPKSTKFTSEEKLRKQRYDFLLELSTELKIDKIALAHTLDDQAETVLMRIIRGTGLYGLISILPKRKIDKFTVIRPMLEVSRKEINHYLRVKKLRPRMDKTNLSCVFLRNRIRHKLLKDLEGFNSNIKETLARFAQQAAVDYDYLCKQSRPYLKSCGNVLKIDLDKFIKLHMAIQRMAIRLAYEKIAGDLRAFTNTHWQEVQDLINSRPFGSVVHLTKGVSIRKDRKHIVVYGLVKDKAMH
jgi:tRNA(Ile)-lysidine synthase